MRVSGSPEIVYYRPFLHTRALADSLHGLDGSRCLAAPDHGALRATPAVHRFTCARLHQRSHVDSHSSKMPSLDQDHVLDLFRRTGALLEGHFRLSSGLHSNGYLQSALVLADPVLAAQLGAALADRARAFGAELVLSPALGGLIIGHDDARALGVRAIFSERQEARMTLRGVIFDLDGVITDTAEYHYRGWKRLADENSWPFDRARLG